MTWDHRIHLRTGGSISISELTPKGGVALSKEKYKKWLYEERGQEFPETDHAPYHPANTPTRTRHLHPHGGPLTTARDYVRSVIQWPR